MSKKPAFSEEARFVKALAALAQISRLRVFRLLVGVLVEVPVMLTLVALVNAWKPRSG